MFLNKLILVLLISNIAFLIADQNSFCLENSNSTNFNTTTECNVIGKLLSKNEKETLKNFCNIRSKFFNDTHILTLSNGTFKFLKQLSCNSDLMNVELVWLSYDEIDNILKENKKIYGEIIAKSTNDSLAESTICSFNTRNQNCGIEFQNQSSVLISHFNLLAQLLPLELTISDVNYKPWKNVTSSGYPIPMSAKIYLSNHQPNAQKLFDTIKYLYFEKVSLNLSEIMPEEITSNLEMPVKIDYTGNFISIENDGNAYAHKSKEITFSRILPPLNGEYANLIGEWSTYIVEFSATAHYNYGSGHIGATVISDCKMTVKTITDIDIEFSGPTPLNYSTSTLTQTTLQPENREYNANKENEIHQNKEGTSKINDKTIDNRQLKVSGGRIYPNFYPWFVGSCIIIAVTCFIVFGNMINILIKEKKLKRQRYRTGSLM